MFENAMAKDVQFEGCDIDDFGSKNKIREIIEKAVKVALEKNYGVCFCHSALKDGEQIDIMKIKSSNGKTLGQIISELFYGTSNYRTSIYKYFLREYVCYYEVPTVRKKYGSDGFGATYEKFLITSNPVFVAQWMNMSVDDATAKFGKNLVNAMDDNDEDLFPYVKLVQDVKTGERKVTRPRNLLDLAKRGTRVYPAFVMQEVANYLYEKSKTDVVRVNFLKDGGEYRSLDFTFNTEKLEEVYGDCDYVRNGLANSYVGDVFDDGTTLQRGYMKVIEIGNSRYDFPTRNISISRIGKFEIGVEPDLTFVDIDVNAAVEACTNALEFTKVSLDKVKDSLITFNLIDDKDAQALVTMDDVSKFITDRRSILTSLWDRQIALYMLANPDIYPNYTGQPKETSSDEDISIEDAITKYHEESSTTTDDLGFSFEDVDNSESKQEEPKQEEPKKPLIDFDDDVMDASDFFI